jgi:uncharacterized protein
LALMRVWIDLSNSPHPLLFAPVARALEERGHEVLVTSRDNAQTVPLARKRWPDVEVLGDESPAGRLGKARGIGIRVASLVGWGRDHRPDVALSHNSYAQVVAARQLRIPAVTAMDFEHQPVNHLAFRLAGRVLLPEAFPDDAARRQGATPGKTTRYPGLKESLYLGDFEHSDEPLRALNIDVSGEAPLAVARTPPSRAIYHRLDNPLFEACLRHLDKGGTEIVVLPRHPEQVDALRSLGLARCTIATEPVDSRSLLSRASLFIGAGGTMTREAALLGVPTATLFAGEVPAVDLWLEARGKLVRPAKPSDLPAPRERPRTRPDPAPLREAAAPILERFVTAVESAAR